MMSLERFLHSIWIALLMTSKGFGFKNCPQFTRLGCFRDSLNPRPLPTILMTDRDPSMRVFSGVNIDWADWNDYKTDLACRCAKKTKKSGFKVFGLQFYGECWSGVNAEKNYKQDGPSQSCLTNDFRKCGPQDKYCVGEQATNFVYTLNASNPAPQPTNQPRTKPTTAPKTKPTMRPEALQCYVYNLTLELTNTPYDDGLSYPHAAEFIALRTDFEVGILQVYDEYDLFAGVTTLLFSPATDGMTIVHFVIEFNTNGAHLPLLTKALTFGTLGKFASLSVATRLNQIACYEAPAPLICPLPCPSLCAPSCYTSCCQQYQYSY
ncbi:uncharacterized protein LOC111323827 [Stylophora pistillata]|uniref:uncharacterized protein LOC111323827 n=1 Tax=Stylophora pistillata TaxID=50429 RepID=UPI000C03E63B|nr:uncharacterized protein LOC111323827 [Stylophora pistillata]